MFCPDSPGKVGRRVNHGCGGNVEMGRMPVRFTQGQYVHENGVTFLTYLKKCEPRIFVSSKKDSQELRGGVLWSCSCGVYEKMSIDKPKQRTHLSRKTAVIMSYVSPLGNNPE